MSNDEQTRRCVSIERPHTLPLRLTRRKPPIGFAFLLGAAMAVVAGGVVWGLQFLTEETTLWPGYLFAGIFGLIGFLLLWSALHRIIASRVPGIVIDLSEQPFRRGHSIDITLTQAGPASFSSLHAKIECLEQHFTWAARRRNDPKEELNMYRTVKEKVLYEHELVKGEAVRPRAGETRRQVQGLTLPENLPASRESEQDAILWRLVVSGTGVGASFRDEFDIGVA
jgi:hypothetical protein